MASIDWQKQTKQKAGAMRTHLGKREREERNHSNPDIDKSKSSRNYYIGCDDYEEAYQKMCDRVREVDKKNPPKKVRSDRVVCASLEIPCPLEITEQGRSREFFEASHELLKDFFGAENVNGMCVHLDEVHQYIDGKDGQEKTSLEHAHTLITAYAEWSEKDKETGEKIERKGINGKNFETKSRLNALNKAMCEMVREKFDVEYNTGEQARKQTAEHLKAQTAKAERIKAEAELAEAVQKNNDFVRSLEPTPTKKGKGIFKIEQPKTEEELQRDREVLAAQAVLQRESDVARKEQEFEEKARAKTEELNQREQAFYKRAGEKTEELNQRESNVTHRENNATRREQELKEKEKNFSQTVAIQSQYKIEKVLRNMGVKFDTYDVQRQIEQQAYMRLNQSRGKER